jgi:hypothetical protein
VVVQSIGTFRAVVLERNEDTWDLVDLTGMGPRRILRGLLMANLVQAQLYAAALAPFLAMAYLLRGLDLLSIAFALIVVPMAGIAGSTCAVMMASLGTNKASRGFLGGVLGLGLLGLWIATFSFWMNLTYGSGLDSLLDEIRRGGREAWLFIGLMFNCWFAFVTAMLVFAGALMAHRAADRSGSSRLLWLVLWLNALAWFITLGWWDGHTGATASHIGEALAAFTVFGVLWAAALGVFSVTEEFELSPRQARAITQPGRLRFITLLLGPGAARGRLVFLALTAASLIVGWCGALLSEHDWAQQTVNAGLVLATAAS